jgi:tRNA nucleotidyltransferase (CCA-adding enzyme)
MKKSKVELYYMLKITKNLKSLARLFPAEAPLYLVGGAVRNALLGLAAADTDTASRKTAEEAASIAAGSPFRVEAQYNALGTLKLSAGAEKIEYTAFRKEVYAGGGHRPVSVCFGGDIQSDARRRDFTVNAVYYDVAGEKIADPLNGAADLKNKLIRAADDPEKVFSADGLRLLRMVRLACELGFEIEPQTLRAAEKHAGLLSDIKPERIRAELDKILLADRKYDLPGNEAAHFRGVMLLKETGLLPYIFPGIEKNYGISQNPRYHRYDVFTHMARTLLAAPPEIRLAALLHDAAKGVCFLEEGNVSRHAAAGAELVRGWLGQRGLKYPNAVAGEVSRLVGLHMYDGDGKTSNDKVKLFIAKHAPLLPKLLALKRADFAAKGVENAEEASAAHIERVRQGLLTENAPLSLRELQIRGGDIAALGCPPKYIGGVLNELLRRCILHPAKNEKTALTDYAARLIAKRIKEEGE